MRNIFSKIPLIIWAVTLSLVAFIVVKYNYFSSLNPDQMRLLSGFLTFIGLIFVAINIQQQWKNERIKTEYLNQPDFIIKGFNSNELKNSGPVLCPNPTECTEDHWLDLEQSGSLAALDLKVALFTEVEANDSIQIDDRWLFEKRLGKKDGFQYKLPIFKIPFEYFSTSKNMCFVLLLEYRSEYSGIRYKRVYSLWASPKLEPKSVKENDWKNRISFYESSLIMTCDTDSIKVKDIFLSKWLQLAIWAKIKKDYTVDEWLINF